MIEMFMKGGGVPPSPEGAMQEEQFMMHTLGYLASNSVHNVG